MADLDRYLQYLQRDDVAELVLQTGKVAALRLKDGRLHPLTKQSLVAGHIVALLDGVGLRAMLPSRDTAGDDHSVELDSGHYRCRVARSGDQLQVRVARAEPGAAPSEATPTPTPTPRPASEPVVAAARLDGKVELEVDGDTPGLELDTDAMADVRRESGHASGPAATRTPAPPATPARASAPTPAPTPTRTPTPASAPARTSAPASTSAPTRASAPAPASGGPSLFRSRPPTMTWTRGSAEQRVLALLREAREAGCSDVHLVGNMPARMRRLAELLPIGEVIPEAGMKQMLDALLGHAGPKAREQLERLGYADFALELEGAGRLRVNFARGRSGLKGCFRLVVERPPTLDELGLPPELAKVGSYHQGLAVVSGPSGQGKTTTMAALVDLVNASKPHHIITVEDPIEVVHPVKRAVISQRQVGLHTESFHRALKAALREDPDVIVIGELRDRETVEMALQAAETGHLVIASMSTPSGAKTIDRLIDMFPPEDQQQVRATMAGALKIVVSQRLVPTADRTRLVAAAELITGSVPLWSLIRENKLFQLPSLLQRGRSYGMIRVEDSLDELLAAGTIDLETARAHADDPKLIGRSIGMAVGGVAAPGAAAASTSPSPSPAGGVLGGVRSLFGRGKSDNKEGG